MELRKKTVTLKPVEKDKEKKKFFYILFSPDSKKKETIIEIHRDGILFGREKEKTRGIVIEDPKVSRVHGKINLFKDSDKIEIVDLGSKNGIFLNGKIIKKAIAKPQDIIRVGDTFFTILSLDIDLPLLIPQGSTIVAKSCVMRKMYEDIMNFSSSASIALIEGETGTGKELVAREIYNFSRRKGNFVPINCAAIPEALFESSFFGAKKGSFTGATSDIKGYFLEANGGTLFLDEIEELKIEHQAKLLRVIETKEVVSVGETKPFHVDVRIVAATNKNMEEEVKKGRFRPDLFARLSRWYIKIPPLRERKEDIIPIAEHFISQINDKLTMHPDFIEALLIYEWEYNVRELVTIINNCCAKVKGNVLTVNLLPDKIKQKVIKREAEEGMRGKKIPSKEELNRTFQKFNGKISDIAKYYNKDRRQIYRWIQYYGLRIENFRNFTNTSTEDLK